MASLRGTARTLAGEPFWKAHPNLRGIVEGRFEEDIAWQGFAACEQPVVFSALSHGALAEKLPELEAAWRAAGIAERLLLVDLSGDFRLQDPAVFAKAYKRLGFERLPEADCSLFVAPRKASPQGDLFDGGPA